MSWIVCQIGAREHYAVGRALAGQRVLGGLITDLWVRPGNPLELLNRSLRERFHPGLDSCLVDSFTVDSCLFEATARLRGLKGWGLILARNRWFQRKVVRALRNRKPETLKAEIPGSQSSKSTPQPILFSYSYTALEPFRFAKSRGWRTVLGQIDGGPEEAHLVAQLEEAAGQYNANGHAPAHYWDDWRREVELADHVVVNSEWSEELLVRGCVPFEKIEVVPLAYEPPVDGANYRRDYPETFDYRRPLRVLFLGQVNHRKGVEPLLDAAQMLRSKPVEFRFVGPIQMNISRHRSNSRIRWFGPVARSAVAGFYRDADVFVFPTFSDGFGLTQLEAQAWKLPIIASRFCGSVVDHGINGLILEEISAKSLTDAFLLCLRRPRMLREISENAVNLESFSLKRLGEQLNTLVEDSGPKHASRN